MSGALLVGWDNASATGVILYTDVYLHGETQCASGVGNLYLPRASVYGTQLDDDDDGDLIPMEDGAKYGRGVHSTCNLHSL